MMPDEVAVQVLQLLGRERFDPEEPLAWERVYAWVANLAPAQRPPVRAALVALLDLNYRNPAAEPDAPWMHVALPSGMQLDDLLALETVALVAAKAGWGEALPRLQATLRDMRWHAIYPNVRQLQRELDWVLTCLGETVWGRCQAAILGSALGEFAATGAVAAAPESPVVAALRQVGSDEPAEVADAPLVPLVREMLARPVADVRALNRRELLAAVAAPQAGAVGTDPLGADAPVDATLRGLWAWAQATDLEGAFAAAGPDPVAAEVAGGLTGLALGLPALPRRRMVDLPDRESLVTMADRLAARQSPGLAQTGTLC